MRAGGVLVLLLLIGCLFPSFALAQVPPSPQVASAQLVDRSGRLLAVASLRETPEQVLINLTFPQGNPLTGTRALQIHEGGRCDPPDFGSAGGIFNPFGKQHGLLNPAGPMAGDLPSLVLGTTGMGTYNTSAPLVRLTSGQAALLRPGGTSLVIYERVDDDLTQPEGNPGARLACGPIVAGAAPTLAAGALPAAQAAAPGGLPGGISVPLLVGIVGIVLIGGGLLVRGQARKP
jgi:Cu-Zn family superoxide dismutase